MDDHTIGLIMIIAAAAVLMAGICWLTWLDHRDERRRQAPVPTAERHVVIESDEPLNQEDFAAVRHLLHANVHAEAEQLFQAIVAQVAEDSAAEELDTLLDEIRGDGS